MKESKVHSPEYVSKDILDEEFVRTFKLFHGLQFILGSCSVEAKDQFVTAPTRNQKAYTLFCIFATLISNILVLQLYYEQISGRIYLLTAIAIWHGFATYAILILNARFFKGQENADFFIRMQKLDRIMGLDKVKGINLILKRMHQTSLFLLLFPFFAMFVLACTRMNILYLTFAGAIYNQLTGMVELIYCSNLIVYFFIRMRFINCIIKNHLAKTKETENKKPSVNLFSNRNLKKLAIETHNFLTSDTPVYMKELFDLFLMFQNVYRFQLFIFCLKLVFGNLCVFGIILYSIQKNAVDVMGVGSMVLFTVIDIFISIFIGLRLQMFFGEVKETKRLSIAVMAEYSSGQLREKARKMLKMANETPPTLSIYDMYNMDAGIFLSIFGLITSLIVTLLQFAFL